MSYDYGYRYGYGYDPMPYMDEEIAIILGIMLVVFGVLLLFVLAFAILRSWALYTVAKRRGIRNAWLSWLPIGCHWILGSLSDQYQHLVKGQVKSRRKILLALTLVNMAVSSVLGIMSGVMSMIAVTEEELLLTALLSLAFSLVGGVLGIVLLIFYHMCNYDLYCSFDPEHAAAFLVLGILFSVTEPFFYFCNRKKDLGMIVPKQAVPAAPAAPVQNFGPEL